MVPSQPARQPSWCQDAKISRFPSRARPSGLTGRVSLVCRESKNRPFWYPDTNMASYHENILLTIQKLCFQGAKATKISIFWYPQTPPKQLSGRAGAKMGWGGGAKPAARQPSWCQDAKISRFLPARETVCLISSLPLVCRGDPKTEHFAT